MQQNTPWKPTTPRCNQTFHCLSLHTKRASTTSRDFFFFSPFCLSPTLPLHQSHHKRWVANKLFYPCLQTCDHPLFLGVHKYRHFLKKIFLIIFRKKQPRPPIFYYYYYFYYPLYICGDPRTENASPVRRRGSFAKFSDFWNPPTAEVGQPK